MKTNLDFGREVGMSIKDMAEHWEPQPRYSVNATGGQLNRFAEALLDAKDAEIAALKSMQPAPEPIYQLFYPGECAWRDVSQQAYQGFADVAHRTVYAAQEALRAGREPVGEVVLFGADLKEVSWRKGKMPAPGTKLYAAPPPDQAAEIAALRQTGQQALDAWQTSCYGDGRHHKAMLLAMTALAQAVQPTCDTCGGCGSIRIDHETGEGCPDTP